jgi:hypothetical protein
MDSATADGQPAPMPPRGPIPDQAGGVPVLSTMGTPRTLGASLGERLRPRLQVATQAVLERAAPLLASGRLDPDGLRQRLLPALDAMRAHQPGLALELEALADAAQVQVADLLALHAGDGLQMVLGGTTCDATACALLGRRHLRLDGPGLVFAWQVAAHLLPSVAVVRRIPAHGPASLTLGIAGVHALAGLSEAGLAVAANPFPVADAGIGLPLPHLIQAALLAPGAGDALVRIQAGPRLGGGALHVMTRDGGRTSLELTGSQTVRLDDQRPDAPRVHTGHALSDQLHGAAIAADRSRADLVRLAGHAVNAIALGLDECCGWFGVGPGADAVPGWDAARTVVAVLEPGRNRMHIARGDAPLDTIDL